MKLCGIHGTRRGEGPLRKQRRAERSRRRGKDVRRQGEGNEHNKSSEPEPSRINPLQPPTIFLSSAGHNVYLQIVREALKTACEVQRAFWISTVSHSHKWRCAVTMCRLQGYTGINGSSVDSSRLLRRFFPLFFFLFYFPPPSDLLATMEKRAQRLSANNRK